MLSNIAEFAAKYIYGAFMPEQKIRMIERLTDEMEVTGGNLSGTSDMYRLQRSVAA